MILVQGSPREMRRAAANRATVMIRVGKVERLAILKWWPPTDEEGPPTRARTHARVLVREGKFERNLWIAPVDVLGIVDDERPGGVG